MAMATVRVYPDEKIQTAILEAAMMFEARLTAAKEKFDAVLISDARLLPTERKVMEEIY